MTSIPDNFIENLSSRIDIVDLISRYITLKKAGTRYKGKCPFHDDNDPSFTVNSDKGFWYCFGCSTGGDAISFIRKQEGLDFVEAVKFIADIYGIPVPETGKSESSNRVLYDINQAAKIMFHKFLSSGMEGRLFRKYLTERGFNPETIKAFEVGASPESWDFIKDGLSNFKRDDMVRAGVLINNKEKDSIYDRFRYRLIIPIIDNLGRVAGFGGRIMKGDGPKYINSPESDIFKKSNILFGLSLAKESCRESGDLIVMEGYTDVMMCWQSGLKNSCAVMGTALTEDHIPVLKRFARRVILLFDGDKAGVKATVKSVSAMVDSGLKVLVAKIGKGNDPASLAHESGADKIKSIIENAISGDDWLISMFAKPVSNKPLQDKMKMLANAARFINKHESEPMRDELIEKATIQFKVPASAIIEIMRNLKENKGKASNGNVARMVSNIEKAERNFLMSAMNYPDTFGELKELLDQDDFDVPIHKLAFKVMTGIE
ncbi:MAG: DNA primase [Candidatus Marinimicrobia bacterium]|nr:DNA primase [Candidatus Neomarinimicrobiota bacterium]